VQPVPHCRAGCLLSEHIGRVKFKQNSSPASRSKAYLLPGSASSVYVEQQDPAREGSLAAERVCTSLEASPEVRVLLMCLGLFITPHWIMKRHVRTIHLCLIF
jgi:hypothetical protein